MSHDFSMNDLGSLVLVSSAPGNPSRVPFSEKYFLTSSGLNPLDEWIAELYSIIVVIFPPSSWKNFAAQYPTFPNP